MFTGIINHLGRFREYRRGKREIILEASSLAPGLKLGDSVAVNGVCLSLTKKNGNILLFDLSEETQQKTSMCSLRRGDLLNLELPLTLSAPLGGHLVTGHVDSAEKVIKIKERRNGKKISISLSPELRHNFIPKGSVAVNGVSLTITEIGSASFDTEIIPITLKNSNLGKLKRGDSVNIECDIIGKYVYNYISKEKQK